jgi:hypothetical protein
MFGVSCVVFGRASPSHSEPPGRSTPKHHTPHPNHLPVVFKIAFNMYTFDPLDPLDQPEQPPRSPQPNPLGKVTLINFGIMLAYMALTGITFQNDSGSEAGLASLIFDAMLLTLQVGVNIVVGVFLLFTENKHIGKAMLISGVLMAIIGFGACLGKAAMVG